MTHVDVLIVGAGLSGIGAACRLRTQCPDRDYLILEGRDAIGGTWDLFRFPGVRSDSDMFTLGYPFRPWSQPRTIACGPSIRQYIRDTAAEFGVDRRIRFGHRVTGADWDGTRWVVQTSQGEFTCQFLYMCTGYYRYDQGHVVQFPGQDTFRGEIVHPQTWPADLDHTDKNVVVVGSGATAVTVVPAMAKDAKHVTMVQRSPSYYVTLPSIDPLKSRLPGRIGDHVVRGRNLLFSAFFYQFLRRRPQQGAALLRKWVAAQVGDTVPLEPHFTPHYQPWDQRLCVVPDGDLFKALRDKRASIVTDHVDTFTKDGIRLRSGRELPADIIVTATGLEVLVFGGIRVTVGGVPVDPGKSLIYKGMMLGGVPNLAWCIGYTNASWTLRADLTWMHVCRLFNHMRTHGYTTCVANPHGQRPSPRPILDLTSGYIQRATTRLPKQGSRTPWLVRQNYLLDALHMRLSRVDDSSMTFR